MILYRIYEYPYREFIKDSKSGKLILTLDCPDLCLIKGMEFCCLGINKPEALFCIQDKRTGITEHRRLPYKVYQSRYFGFYLSRVFRANQSLYKYTVVFMGIEILGGGLIYEV